MFSIFEPEVGLEGWLIDNASSIIVVYFASTTPLSKVEGEKQLYIAFFTLDFERVADHCPDEAAVWKPNRILIGGEAARELFIYLSEVLSVSEKMVVVYTLFGSS